MQIKNMFEKQIDRDIKGVIKVGQSDEENVYQELDEYVVTKELLKHFRDFFNNYEKGVDGYTDKMGVWISGFFGSGKSHFLKILSYLLKNSTVEGKRAIEYFTDGKKIEDPMLIAEMTKAGTIESDVMLFNIDSKGSAKVGSGKEAIVEVFMKVFNEMQGYCGSIPYLAEFERQLDNEGRFEEFKEKFEANAGAPWDKKRQAFAVIQDKVVKTLVEMDFMSEEAARNWCKNAKGSYDLSIEKFVSLVQEYCAKKGPNHHVIFLVDEIGQYIADDTQLMLNLQTIVEDLGTACKGKAWVIVTSQEDIDSITKTKGNDFSKIQGRFDTRLSLSASNVDEVIRKRVLAKNETATQTLRLLYEQKESIIKNLITFTADTADKKLYADKADFADCYPFIPYQFNLLGQVLTAVRTHGASGKHLSDQSRSMLALFQESAIRVMDKEDGVLVPFSFFYDPLHKFIDHQHSQVISDAENNSKLDEFDVELLKVLFMIKYVKEIKANVDNLTTLMISNIDDDRIEVRSKIEESLKKLIKETLVQKNGEIYIFLTNEEQEINNAINNESVEMGEIIGEASIVIFEEIYTEKKYRYSSRYLFPFNQKVDDRFFKGNQSNDIGVTVITPYGGDYADSALRLLSAQESSVIVKLPNDSTFLDEIGNINQSVETLQKTSSLFDPFPPEMGTDTAFLDRFHAYIPGWEIPKYRPDSFTNDYGFITDYLSEFMRELRKDNYSNIAEKYFKLGNNLNQRDAIAVRKLISGFIKLIYPDGEVSKEEVAEIMDISLELRRRVKEQLKKIGGMEFYDVNFSYIDNDSFDEHFVSVPEQGGGKMIPEGMGKPGCLYTVSKSKTGMIGCYRLETQMMPGNGKLTCTGIGSGKEPKEATNTAFNYLKANGNAISGNISTTTKDYIINYQDMQGLGMTGNLALPTLIAISSAALSKPPISSLAVLGEISIGGTLIKVEDLASTLQVCLDSGAKKVLLPITSAADLGTVPSDLVGAFSLIFYSSPEEAVYKALGVE